MADQTNEKPEAAAPVADAQEAPATESKTGGAESAVAEDKATTAEEARKEDAKVAEGMLILYGICASCAFACICGG